ncbi:hypothetical protein [Streptomyces sp. NBC_01451]|uniref:hypothetical protein n=1 Tax=Streptomyces sp. NBC_01451 TaxID=2903872 RepID=UPI002E3186F5|nr:hypothetical protein [Streptomyces sp. NBC_01451]
MTSAHGEYLRQLITRAKDGAIPQREVKEIARALGAGRGESMGPPEGVTRAEWSEGLLKAARGRLCEAACQL